MKRIIYLLVLSVCGNALTAQNIFKEAYLNAPQIDGVYNCGEYGAVVLKEGYSHRENKDLFTLHYLDESIPTQRLMLPRGNRIDEVVPFKDRALLICGGDLLVLVSPKAEPFYFYHENDEGYGYGSKYVDVTEKGTFVMIRSYSKRGLNEKGKPDTVERGLQYITYSAQGEFIDSRYEPNKTSDISATLTGFFSTPVGVIYHVDYSSSNDLKYYESKLILCDENNVKTGEYSLYDMEQTLNPSDIIFDNGNYIMAGYYVKGTPVRAKNVEGMFMTIIDEKGAVKSNSNYDWDNLKSQLKETKRSDFVFNGRMMVMIEKIENNGSGYTILGESYRTGSGKTGAEMLIGDNNSSELVVSVLDFILFDTDYDGNITSVNILEKEQCNIFMQGFSKDVRRPRLAKILRDNDVFPFKSMENNEISFINYKLKEGAIATMNISSGEVVMGDLIDFEIEREEVVDVDLEKMVENSKLLTKLNNMSDKMEQRAEKLDRIGTALANGIEKIDQVYSKYGFEESGLFYLTNGKILSFKIDPESYAVYYKYLN